MAFKYSKPATKTKEDGPQGGYNIDHPAFGVVQISRISGHTTLFQSELKHNHYIRVRVFKAKKNRSLNTDWVHPKSNPIVEFDMSEAQYATMVSSISLSEGTPVTLVRGPEDTNKVVRYPMIKPESTADLFPEELNETLNKHAELAKGLLDKVESMLEDKTIKKSDLKDLRNDLFKLGILAPKNMKFIEDQFTEHMEKVTENAKSEINGYILKTINTMGLQKHKEMVEEEAPKLIEGN